MPDSRIKKAPEIQRLFLKIFKNYLANEVTCFVNFDFKFPALFL